MIVSIFGVLSYWYIVLYEKLNIQINDNYFFMIIDLHSKVTRRLLKVTLLEQ